MQKIESSLVHEGYFKVEHPSGLTILMYPMQGFNSAFAMFTTDYGSVDMTFKTDPKGDYFTIPAGTAHFLEHKMFEDEDGDAFDKYAATGASANAFTTYDKTSYLFSCTDHFEEALKVLLGFVTSPYFTKQTVDKEQGIIGQEIKMYDDHPYWQLRYGIMRALYSKHPVSVDIAGSVESIAQITAESLYKTYHAFYNLHNMVLTVAGNFSTESVIKVADQVLTAAPDVYVERAAVNEPDEIVQKRVEKKLAVSSPMFALGIKIAPSDYKTNTVNSILDEIINEILAGDSSPLYRRLYDNGLINSSFDSGTECGRDYSAVMFSGESKDPDRTAEEILNEITRVQRDGIDPEAFLRCKKAVYSRYIRIFERPDSVANALFDTYFAGMDLYDLLDVVNNSTLQQVQRRFLDAYKPERSALSVILPLD